MNLDPDVIALLEAGAKAKRVPLHQLPVSEARDFYAQICEINGLARDTSVHARDVIAMTPATNLWLRVYRPEGLSLTSAPALVFYHGGGWVVGDLDTHDPVCRYLAKASQCCVISVNYRLAPEHPFPAAVIDSSAAFDWIVRNAATIGIDINRIGVAGDSAGGFLATYVALERMIANEEVKPHIQVLFYPVTDLTAESEGYSRVTEGFSFTSVTMRWFRDHYVVSSRSPSDTRLAPLLYPNLAGLPATFIVTSKYDPLCEEGVDYATRLEDVGVRVSHLHLGDQIHGFLTLGARIKVAESVLNLAGDYIRKELGRKETLADGQ